VVREKPPKREPPTTERSERMPPGEVGQRRTGGQVKDEAFMCSSDLGSARPEERIDNCFFFPSVLERGVRRWERYAGEQGNTINAAEAANIVRGNVRAREHD
jgi:hypothetical protein